MKLSHAMSACVAAAATCATPAPAQYGRLIPAPALVRLFNEACTANAPDFARRVPVRARSLKWDELGRTASAKPGERGWLIAVGGLPAIVDISAPATATQTCSASAVTDPQQVSTGVERILGRKPDATRAERGQRVVEWRPAKRIPYLIRVTTTPGQAMARLTVVAR